MNEVVLHQSGFDNPNELKNLTSEMRSSVLDCAACKTVCGKEWLAQYVNNPSDEDQQEVSYTDLEMVERSNLYIPLKSLPALEATNLI